MTITVVLKDEDPPDWSDVDTIAVQRMIAAADSEGGEYSLDDIIRTLDAVIEGARRSSVPSLHQTEPSS